MMLSPPLSARLVLVAAALLAPAVASQTLPAPKVSDQSANALPEVRLRKLHLVRPDLIPYPIAFEVLC
jgi:hypothetical protein